MEIFASSKSMLQVKMLAYRHHIKLNLFSDVTYRILSWSFQPEPSAVQGTDR